MTTSRGVFEAYDASGHFSLWVTDGTPAATSELTVSGAAPLGVFEGAPNPDFVVVGDRALFEGEDASFHYNLWVTDGTSAGTSELTVAGAISGGLLLNGTPALTRFGSEAVFAGEDANNVIGLWITDGTSSGTSELTPAGADPTGLLADPAGGPDFTVLGNKVLFAGRDANFHLDLWVTDGTSAGTSELTPAGANPIGLLSVGVGGPHFTVLGSKALFVGSGAGAGSDLWVTDGTSAGTRELTVPGLLGPQSDFTVLGSKALFEGINASSTTGLWVTDGTSSGTSQLTVAGASFLGPFLGINPDLTALGSKAVFASLNAGAAPNLAVTDGTSAGTSELAVAGANSSGLFAP
jgi:ELWxxDGT repeat protein